VLSLLQSTLPALNEHVDMSNESMGGVFIVHLHTSFLISTCNRETGITRRDLVRNEQVRPDSKISLDVLQNILHYLGTCGIEWNLPGIPMWHVMVSRMEREMEDVQRIERNDG